MKFGELHKQRMTKEWQFFYVHYDELKQIIADGDDVRFHKLLQHELCKVNEFCGLINKYDPSHPDLREYIVNNYMALFKAIKKHDKVLCKTYKLNFFQSIKEHGFYKYYCNIKRHCDKIKLVIFDKDGTLINMLAMFGPWTKALVENMKDILPVPAHVNVAVSEELKENTIWDRLGYNGDTNEFSFDSIVARGTNDDIRNCLCEFIMQHSSTPMKPEEVRSKVQERWVEPKVNAEDVTTTGDLHKLFESLRSAGIKIAICTSDDRAPTQETIKLLGIGKYVEVVVCGDDAVSSKPSPEPIWDICNKLDVQPSETVMIGDTISDIHAGINAKCGNVVAVLTGGYKDAELEQADHIIPSVDHLYPIIVKNHQKKETTQTK